MDGHAHLIFAHIHLDSVFIWGLVATAVLTILMNAAQGLGFSRMSLSFMLGTMLTADRDKAQILGFICHLGLGWVFAFFYALIFEALRMANVWLGMAIGLGHGLFVLTSVIPLLPYIHPRMANEHHGPTPTRLLEPPGFMALHYGRNPPLISLVSHFVFGGILGFFYEVVINNLA